MEQTSPRLGLSYIAPAQAQKHVTANETFTRLDTLVQLSVVSASQTSQPSTPAQGETYILPAAATGPVWENLAQGSIAAFQDGHWQTITPKDGWRAWSVEASKLLVFQAGDWTALSGNSSADNASGSGGTSPSPSTLPTLGINTLAETSNRLSVKSDSVLLSHDDQTPGTGDMRLAINRAATSKTASVLFQNAFTTRAEIGLFANNELIFKTSPNGTNFKDSLTIDAATGFVKTDASLSVNRTVPSDFWSASGSNSALFLPYGYFGSNGSFGLGLWYNGYRSSQGQWASQAINGSDVGSGFELQNSGCFVRYQRGPAGLFPAIRLRVTETQVSPGSDNLLTLGSPSHRWAQIYSASGAINTSDARHKDVVGAVSDQEKAVARRILGKIVKYRWKASVAEKGAAARQHFGVTAQDVKAAFEAEGLEAAAYGVWCEDAVTQLNDDPVKGVQEHVTEDTQQGVRYEELLVFLMASLL